MLDFGQYAPFIWGAYGISALVLLSLVIYTLRSKPRD